MLFLNENKKNILTLLHPQTRWPFENKGEHARFLKLNNTHNVVSEPHEAR